MTRRANVLLLAGTFAASVGFLALGGGVFAQPAEDKATAPKADGKTVSTVPVSEVSKRIDAEIAKVWERDGIKPAGASDDAEFLRRVYIDTVGLPPEPAEVEAFLADKSKDKRATLIDKLLADPRYSQHLADNWTNIIVGRGGRRFNGSNHLFAMWMSEQLQAQRPFSDIMYDIVTASGSLSENPAVAPLTVEQPLRVPNIAGNLSKNLTGTQIQCAECHDHPYEEAWTEEVFGGVASFFSPLQLRVNVRMQPVDPTITDDARPVRTGGAGMERLPEDAQNRLRDIAKYSKPVSLDGVPLKTKDRSLWRAAYAKWMVSSENKQTARYIANRFWSFTFGMGLLNPVDDFNSFNEASHPELLEYLGQDLIDNKYDVRRLYRAILNSKTWQLSSKDRPQKAEAWHFASAGVRQLSAEQFFGALVQIAGGDDMARAFRMRSNDPGQAMQRAYERRVRQAEADKENPNAREYESNPEALERYVAWYRKFNDGWYMRRSMAEGFSRLSSDDEMTDVDGFSLTIDQALLVMNGEVTNKLSGTGRGTFIYEVTRASSDNKERVRQVYLRVLARTPSSSELNHMVDYVKGEKDQAKALEDVMFALLASTEFATNH